MIVRMQQKGDFKDEENESDTVSETYKLELLLAERSRVEAHISRQKQEAHVL